MMVKILTVVMAIMVVGWLEEVQAGHWRALPGSPFNLSEKPKPKQVDRSKKCDSSESYCATCCKRFNEDMFDFYEDYLCSCARAHGGIREVAY